MKRVWTALLLAGVMACGQERDADGDPGLEARVLLAPAVRRLSVHELQSAAQSVAPLELDLIGELPPDARQHDFSRSLTQSADPLTLTELYDAVRVAAEKVDLGSSAFPACALTAGPNDAACAEQVVGKLSSRAFRRAATSAETLSLKAVFAQAATTSFRDGVVQLLRALLGSPQFLYETSLGDADDTGTGRVRLSDTELASHLAWLVSGRPPDDELIEAGARGALRASAEREKQAWRLLGEPDSRHLYRRFVEEWFGISKLGNLAKSSAIIDDFPRLRAAMLRETHDFVDDALMSSGGSLSVLLAGNYSLPPAELAGLHGIEPTAPGQRVSLAGLGRVGILQHASFLSTFAHEAESAPVLRGKAVLERLLCRRQIPPAELGIDLVLPAPDPSATTRERFQRHASMPECAACHRALDGVGFAFENFDAVGRSRTSEAGKPIDSSGQLSLDGVELALTDSAALARALAESDEYYECAARHWMRFASAEAAPEVEADFVARTRELPDQVRNNLVGLVLAYVKSDWFAYRERP